MWRRELRRTENHWSPLRCNHATVVLLCARGEDESFVLAKKLLKSGNSLMKLISDHFYNQECINEMWIRSIHCSSQPCDTLAINTGASSTASSSMAKAELSLLVPLPPTPTPPRVHYGILFSASPSSLQSYVFEMISISLCDSTPWLLPWHSPELTSRPVWRWCLWAEIRAGLLHASV